MGKSYEYLDEMRVRFANTRLREFIADGCLPEINTPNLDLDSDKRVGFADFVVRKSLVRCHKTWMRIEAELKKANVQKETFSVHYDTLVLQIMTWIRFSLITRCIQQDSSTGVVERDDSTTFSNCLSLSSAMSQLMMTELMGSGHESEDFKSVDDMIEEKVSRTFDESQKRLVRAVSSGKEPRPTFVAFLLNALNETTAESLRFALKEWDLSANERSQLTEKLNRPLPEEAKKNVTYILVRAIIELEAEIDEIYAEALSVHGQIFK